jgi:large subunit ribosomal protein LP2
MKAIAAYMMAVVGGNPNPTVDDVSTILGAVSIQLTPHEAAQLDEFITDNAGRTADEMIGAGMIVVNKTSGRSAAPALETAVDAPVTLDDASSDESDDDAVEGGLTMFDDY